MQVLHPPQKVECLPFLNEATGIRSMVSRSLQWYDLPTEFHKNLPTGSEVIRRDSQTDSGDLIILTFLFNGSRLKRNNIISVLSYFYGFKKTVVIQNTPF
jgi:hypothetical protein